MCIARDEDRTLVVTLQLSLTGPQLTCRQLGDLAALPCGANLLTFVVYKGAAKEGVEGGGLGSIGLLEKTLVEFAGR